ncbi:hypothetical protein JRQ81_007124 [Phrynocephalus forsythii]|uniref:Core-binding (CB) domain-containing protein n=1 Tax=Phrynocephalus forsythii TaxID=171643 RepID=A0A9Q0XD77_9SAUR|nr:hypothetical protein JRQ81_007124 [Phrynocephalus forsythii]
MLAQQAPQPETSGGRASGAAQTEDGGAPPQPCPMSFWTAEPGSPFNPYYGDSPLRRVEMRRRKQPCRERWCPESNSGCSASPGKFLSDIPPRLRASLQPFGQGPMKPWHLTAMEAILRSLEPSTLEAYKEAMVRFWDYNVAQEGGKWPTSEEAILRYLVSLKHAGVSPDTMTAHLEAISFFSQACGYQDLSDSFRARTAIEGWRRMALLHPDSFRAITDSAEALY